MPTHVNFASGISAIFFDLDNTLIDRNLALRRYLPCWLATYAPWLPKKQYATEIVRIMQQDEWGCTDRAAFCSWLKQTYEVSSQSVDGILNDLLLNIPPQLAMNPEVRNLLLGLKQKFTIGIISNGSGKTQRAKMKQTELDTLFDPQYVYIEGEIGQAKPHAAIFSVAIQATGLAPDKVLFVGDDPEKDSMGASNAGMKTCWISHGRAFPSSITPPDLLIEHVVELAHFVYA